MEFRSNNHDNSLLSKPPSSPSIPKYRECLKNHAASVGGHVLDGCGEFMPIEDDILKCAACACHRSFHRKSPVVTAPSLPSPSSTQFPLLLSPPPLFNYPHQHNQFPLIHPTFSGGTATDSSSDERIEQPTGVSAASRKRFRTTFTTEQKEKMMNFAERVGWRLQKQYENAIEEFCCEIGVRRKVFKVWMHNNKHSMRKQVLIQKHPHDQLQHLSLQQPQEQ